MRDNHREEEKKNEQRKRANCIWGWPFAVCLCHWKWFIGSAGSVDPDCGCFAFSILTWRSHVVGNPIKRPNRSAAYVDTKFTCVTAAQAGSCCCWCVPIHSDEMASHPLTNTQSWNWVVCARIDLVANGAWSDRRSRKYFSIVNCENLIDNDNYGNAMNKTVMQPATRESNETVSSSSNVERRASSSAWIRKITVHCNLLRKQKKMRRNNQQKLTASRVARLHTVQ